MKSRVFDPARPSKAGLGFLTCWMWPSQKAISMTENLSIITLESELKGTVLTSNPSRPIRLSKSEIDASTRSRMSRNQISSRVVLQLRQHPVHQRDADRPFAHGGGHALH